MDKKKQFSTFSYKLVQISPIMILVNSGAFLSISSWFLRAHRTNFCHDTQNAKDYGYVHLAISCQGLHGLARDTPGTISSTFICSARKLKSFDEKKQSLRR